MDDLLAARSQMAMSLAFHIIFAAIGIAMPLLMIVAEWKLLRTKDDVYLTLAQRWAKGTAILFAVGAVSGTVLSFELGLLWPGFMGYRSDRRDAQPGHASANSAHDARRVCCDWICRRGYSRFHVETRRE